MGLCRVNFPGASARNSSDAVRWRQEIARQSFPLAYMLQELDMATARMSKLTLIIIYVIHTYEIVYFLIHDTCNALCTKYIFRKRLYTNIFSFTLKEFARGFSWIDWRGSLTLFLTDCEWRVFLRTKNSLILPWFLLNRFSEISLLIEHNQNSIKYLLVNSNSMKCQNNRFCVQLFGIRFVLTINPNAMRWIYTKICVNHLEHTIRVIFNTKFSTAHYILVYGNSES